MVTLEVVRVEVVRVEVAILEDVVAKVMAVTNSVGVVGQLELLQRSLVGQWTDK